MIRGFINLLDYYLCRIGIKYIFLFVLVIFAFSTRIYAQALGYGSAGSPLISGIVNTYTSLILDANICRSELFVEKTSGFYRNDLILIIQMQGAIIKSNNDSTYGMITDYSTAGDFEFAFIDSVMANKIICKHELLHAYKVNGHTQIIRVPQYKNVDVNGILTCPDWNGKTGGIIVLDATGDLNLHADINAMGKGFRGGVAEKGQHTFDVKFEYIAELDPNYYSRKGEGIAGYGVGNYISGRGAPANAGGGGNIHTTGGGGGANIGFGGDGGWGYPVDALKSEKKIFGIGGYKIPGTLPAKILAAGAGGAGHEHFGNGTSGASAGGIVIINCNRILGNGHSIFADGASSAPSGAFGDGAGGAGAGGSIFISSKNIFSPLNLYANGGEGGSSIMKGFGPGGGGGGGLIYFSDSVLPVNILKAEVNAGKAGIAGGAFYGAMNGGSGSILFELPRMPMGKLTVIYASFSYKLNSISSIEFVNTSKGNSNYIWDFDDGKLSNTFSSFHTYESPGLYSVKLIASDGACSDTAFEKIFLGFPNVITPNGDGVNDALDLKGFEGASQNLEFKVYNRWGTIVWESSDYNSIWDGKDKTGKELHAGVYFVTFKIPPSANFQGIDYSKPISILR